MIPLHPAQVRPRLFFGGAPQGPPDVDALARLGVTAVLSLQTDEDLAWEGRRWAVVAGWYADRIIARRFPIPDFSPEALVARLDEALAALAGLLAEGHTVYVHCTAGVNRSPTIVIGHLVRSEGLPLVEALRLVAAARPAAQPYAQALAAIGDRRT